jgi:mono/diheme cytochrome c family protein
LEITANGGSLPNSAMPGFADKLTQEQMAAILDHIKTFWEPDQRATQADITKRWPDQ